MAIHRVFFAAVWLVNGVWFKVLGGEPRHRRIVGEILGESHAGWLTVAIGVGEVGMAGWILSGWWPRLSAWVQIILVLAMNLLEFLLVPELLLFGRWNMVLAVIYCLLVAACELRPRRAA